MTSTKKEIVDYLTEYFTKPLFIIKRRTKYSNDWHSTMEPSSNWKSHGSLHLMWKAILPSELWIWLTQSLVLLKEISVQNLM